MKTAKQKERELIVELHGKGKSSYEIARILGISQTKASFWIRRYRRTKNLEDKPKSGRPTPLTKDTLVSIANAIKSQVIRPKNKAGISSREVLSLIEDKTNKKYTMRHAERLLHKMGFSLITPRISHIRQNEEAQDKFRHEFKKNLKKSIWVIQS